MLINFCKKQKYTFDFSWIEKEVSQWFKAPAEDLRRMIEIGLQSKLVFYDHCIYTHLGERVYDYNDYKRQRKEFCEYIIRKYAKKSC